MDITTIAGGAIVASLLVQVVKVIGGKIEGRWGSLVSQVVLLLASFFVAGVGAAIKLLPPEILNTTITIAVSGMAVYEVVWKAIYKEGIRGE